MLKVISQPAISPRQVLAALAGTGAEVRPVTTGSRTLKDAMNEAMRDWVTNVDDTFYIVGSTAGPHPYPLIVRQLQSIGQESRQQMLEQHGCLPDAVIACMGGGINALGISLPYRRDHSGPGKCPCSGGSLPDGPTDGAPSDHTGQSLRAGRQRCVHSGPLLRGGDIMGQKLSMLLDDLQHGRRKGFFPFLMAGYPDLVTTVELAGVLADAGADLLEIGLPFSDPVADGPLLQAAARHALQQGIKTADVLRVVEKISYRTGLPVLLMSYYNPVLQYGLERMARDLDAAGACGLIVPDLPPEEAGPLKEQLQNRELELIHFLAPTTPPERLDFIAGQSTGFLYCLSVKGVTGLRQEIDTIMPKIITSVRRVSPIPLAIGFGISSPDQAANLARFFEAVIVGSALARVIADCEQKSAPAVQAVYRLACHMRRALQV